MYVLCRFLQPGHTGGKPNAGRSRPLDNIGLWSSESWKTPHEGLTNYPENFVEKHVDVFMQNKGNVSMSLTGGVISKQRWRYSFAERIFNTRYASIFFFFFFWFIFLFFFFHRFRVLLRLTASVNSANLDYVDLG